MHSSSSKPDATSLRCVVLPRRLLREDAEAAAIECALGEVVTPGREADGKGAFLKACLRDWVLVIDLIHEAKPEITPSVSEAQLVLTIGDSYTGDGGVWSWAAAEVDVHGVGAGLDLAAAEDDHTVLPPNRANRRAVHEEISADLAALTAVQRIASSRQFRAFVAKERARLTKPQIDPEAVSRQARAIARGALGSDDASALGSFPPVLAAALAADSSILGEPERDEIRPEIALLWPASAHNIGEQAKEARTTLLRASAPSQVAFVEAALAAFGPSEWLSSGPRDPRSAAGLIRCLLAVPECRRLAAESGLSARTLALLTRDGRDAPKMDLAVLARALADIRGFATDCTRNRLIGFVRQMEGRRALRRLAPQLASIAEGEGLSLSVCDAHELVGAWKTLEKLTTRCDTIHRPSSRRSLGRIFAYRAAGRRTPREEWPRVMGCLGPRLEAAAEALGPPVAENSDDASVWT
jgi:hypothetical protein